MNSISNTAYYCCGIRMEDAERTPSVCNDQFAKRFMDERGMRIYEPFKSETMPNISNISRCRIIDELVHNAVQEDVGSYVITIGAGFDTRPYRLTGGIWVEIDEPQIIDYKNERLPVAECPNRLTRIAIDFSAESLAAKLEQIGNHKPVVIVIEGVFMYLEPESIEDTLRQIQKVFPRHILLCDLMTRKFFERFATSVHSKLVAAGGRFTARPENPAEIFLKNAYIETTHIPMFKRATELGILWDRARIPAPIARLLLRVLVRDLNGYAVHRFAYG